MLCLYTYLYTKTNNYGKTQVDTVFYLSNGHVLISESQPIRLIHLIFILIVSINNRKTM